MYIDGAPVNATPPKKYFRLPARNIAAAGDSATGPVLAGEQGARAGWRPLSLLHLQAAMHGLTVHGSVVGLEVK